MTTGFNLRVRFDCLGFRFWKLKLLVHESDIRRTSKAELEIRPIKVCGEVLPGPMTVLRAKFQIGQESRKYRGNFRLSSKRARPCFTHYDGKDQQKLSGEPPKRESLPQRTEREKRCAMVGQDFRVDPSSTAT